MSSTKALRTAGCLLAVLGSLAAGCSGAGTEGGDEPSEQPASAPGGPATPAPEPEPKEGQMGAGRTLEGGIQVEVLATGTGPEVDPGDTALVHYTGTFPDGRKFDSSRDRGQPFPVPVGRGQVIKGWDVTLAEMRQGDRWMVTIPYALAYGERGGGPIPPRADLVFDIEVLEVQKR